MNASVMVMENTTTNLSTAPSPDEVPCPDPDHEHKQRCWANGCPTCHGRGAVLPTSQRFTIASGPERPVFRHEDLTGSQYG